MCTAFTLLKDRLYFGRNMDIDRSFGQQVVITPRNYTLPTKCVGDFLTKYAMIGIANVTNNYPLYAEATNEKGLCIAGLNFPNNASYLKSSPKGKLGITPYELIPYILGQCESVQTARKLLNDIHLVNIPFVPQLPVATLHWLIADATHSIVLECTDSGMHIYDNPYGVLTNNPPFPFHIDNVRQYLHLSADNSQGTFGAKMQLSPFALGQGALGLPGDFSSPSRFVKTVFCKAHTVCENDQLSCVSQVMHILDSVAMVRGTAMGDNQNISYTIYSCCIDASNGAYFYKTYDNSQITRVDMTQARKESKQLTVLPLLSSQTVAVQ